MSGNQTEAVRRTIHFSGSVQGVGFRYTTQTVAARFPVTGHVRNLPDGRVALVAEGLADDLSRFQRAIDEALGSHITDVSVADGTATGEFDSFRIAM